MNVPFAYGNQNWTLQMEEDTQLFDSLKLVFYGYRTEEDIEVEVWGAPVRLSVFVSPAGAPCDPPEEERPPADRDSLPAEVRTRIAELEALKETLKTKVPSPPDKALEDRYLAYCDGEKLVEHSKDAVAAWTDAGLSQADKCRKAGEALAALYPVLSGLDNLPGELLRDDTQFSLALLRLMTLSTKVVEAAQNAGEPFPAEVEKLGGFLDALLDRMIENGCRMRGVERPMTEEEMEEDSDLYIEALSSEKSREERLEILRKLWENPLRDPDERVESLEQAVSLLEEDAEQVETLSPATGRLMERHLAQVRACLSALEDQGLPLWRERVAAEFFQSANDWREGAMPPVTREEFMEGITLTDIAAKTEEEDGGVICALELNFADKDDSFAGHRMCAIIKDGEIDWELWG